MVQPPTGADQSSRDYPVIRRALHGYSIARALKSKPDLGWRGHINVRAVPWFQVDAKLFN